MEITREKINCGCGCGEIFDKYDLRKRIRFFISGHNSLFLKGRTNAKIYLCDFCHKEFKRRECNIKNYKHKFCSRHCRALWVGSQLKNDIQFKEKMRQKAIKNGNSPPHFQKKSHWNWKGGITPLNKILRTSGEYNQWRKKVFQRDNFTCRICKKRGGKLNADHIKPFCLFPNLRYNRENGQTLCIPCHKNKTRIERLFFAQDGMALQMNPSAFFGA